MNIEERRLEVEQQKQARAEHKARVAVELAELTELAPQVLKYEVVLTMVDKQQTPAQRRAHEPITQSKRWHATCKIAGMTQDEFVAEFDIWDATYGDVFDKSQRYYTQKEALAQHTEACAEEFVRLMSKVRWQMPDTFETIMTTLKAGN
jgi:hypothetical protein